MIRTITATAFSALLGLTLAACGDDGVAASASGTTGGDTTGTTSEGGTTTTATTTSDATSNNSCDACDPDATCNADGTCTCKDGFEGDGQTCSDVDECASGKNMCDPDATCTNSDGDYSCACNDGYKGNGMSCKDVDECSDGVDNCDANATCTNNDGGFACACNDGFTGDGVTCTGGKDFGEVCSGGEECTTGLCLTDTQCTVECSIETSSNDCRDQGYYGLCIFIGDQNYPFVCAGDLMTGPDQDDEIIKAGDMITRDFQSIDDIDVHLAKIAAGSYQIYAEPDLDDDIAIAFYNIDGSLLAELNDGGPGDIEGANVDAGGDPIYVIVANVGNSNGSYNLIVNKI